MDEEMERGVEERSKEQVQYHSGKGCAWRRDQDLRSSEFCDMDQDFLIRNGYNPISGNTVPP